MRRGETDPVCGMKVDRKRAFVSERAGRTVFFCSEACRAAFEANPTAYPNEAGKGELRPSH